MKKRLITSMILVITLFILNVIPVSANVSPKHIDHQLSMADVLDWKLYTNNSKRLQQILTTGYMCDYCYGNAVASCNGERTKGDTRYHDKNCGYITYYSNVRVTCGYCSRSYVLSNSRHACKQYHPTCGAGTVIVCPFS